MAECNSLPGLTLGGIKVNIAGYLYQLTIKERRSVLFVNEEDFSFTVAFAALRAREWTKEYNNYNNDCWNGIVATRYEPVGSEMECQFVGSKPVKCKPAPDLKMVKLECAASAAEYSLLEVHDSCKSFAELELCAEKSPSMKALAKIETSRNEDAAARSKRLSSIVTETREKLASIKKLSIELQDAWQYGIDFQAIPKELRDSCSVIWFQCLPTGNNNVHTLISDFLLALAGQIRVNVLVCIGITTHHALIGKYNLDQGILSKNPDYNMQTVCDRYKLIGVDYCLVNKILSFGYRVGQSGCDYDDHVTLIFQQK